MLSESSLFSFRERTDARDLGLGFGADVMGQDFASQIFQVCCKRGCKCGW